jgi:hypothetical protein
MMGTITKVHEQVSNQAVHVARRPVQGARSLRHLRPEDVIDHITTLAKWALDPVPVICHTLPLSSVAIATLGS